MRYQGFKQEQLNLDIIYNYLQSINLIDYQSDIDQIRILNYDIITQLFNNYFVDYYTRFMILFNNDIYMKLSDIIIG